MKGRQVCLKVSHWLVSYNEGLTRGCSNRAAAAAAAAVGAHSASQPPASVNQPANQLASSSRVRV